MNDRIKQLQEEINAEKRKIDNCQHEFGDAYNNPETVRESYGYRTVAQGSDIWAEPEGYRDVIKPRWTRKCSKCGLEQHTNKKKPIITDYTPDFD